jgi:FKBP-type peptidyl-prolyl cis-trans isomerase FklB
MLFRAFVASVAVLGFGLNFSLAQEPVGGAAPAPIVPANAAIKDPSSYALGFDVGSGFAASKMSEKEIEIKDFITGLLDALNKRDPKLEPAQLQAAFEALQQRMQKKMIEIGKQNLEKANAYLAANKDKDGVVQTKSGLQYKIVKSGSGKQPTLTDTVSVHFEGKLLSGMIFDSTLQRNQPATFQVTKVVPGWAEALQRMKVGDKWIVTVPPALGYGEKGLPPAGIEPNELLLFEMELIDVAKK